jgi:hypothetical protein
MPYIRRSEQYGNKRYKNAPLYVSVFLRDIFSADDILETLHIYAPDLQDVAGIFIETKQTRTGERRGETLTFE